jgi:hypothetical protein
VYATGLSSYADYGIYDYDGFDPNEIVNGSYSYTKGVYFVVTLEELDGWGSVLNSYPLAETRRYTTPELVGQVSLGIAQSYGLSGQRSISRNSVAISGLSVEAASNYYYFAVDQGVTYYLDYEDRNTIGSNLTAGVNVSYYFNGSPIYSSGSYTAPAKGIVTVAVNAYSFVEGDSGTYRLTVTPPATISASASPQTKSIANNATQYYTYTPTAFATTVNVTFNDVASYSVAATDADVDVAVYTYDGIAMSGPTNLAENIASPIAVSPGERVLIVVTEAASDPDSRSFTLTLTE